jgi:FkbM family methyltransferase
MLDVGAAVGMTTKMMLQHSPGSNVIAFEPFPGNHRHFLQRVGADPRVILRRAAVSDSRDDQWFFVSGTVQPGTVGWAGFEGSSSLGFVIGPDDRRVDNGFRVASCRLDDIIDERDVIFTKMDIQGGEAEALRGAALALASHRLKVLLVEFGGDLEVLQLMLNQGYGFYDHEYFLIPRGDLEPDLRRWDVIREGTLSTNAKFFRAWPRDAPTGPEDYCEFFRAESAKIGSVWTDLVFVAPEFMENFEDALTAYNAMQTDADDSGVDAVGEERVATAGNGRLLPARRLIAQIPGARPLVRRLRRWRAGRP